jgi:hypothetical protein
MSVFRRAVYIVLAAAFFLAPPAYATSFSTDQSDLWFIPAESGWGMQLIQRGSIIFATLFVYGPSGEPTWFVSTMDFASNSTWTGALYQTTGPYFETVPFNPALVTVTPVGTMTWASQGINTGTLSYVVNGAQIVKNVVRQTLVLDYFGGNYIGGVHNNVTGCTDSALNGTFDVPGSIDFVQQGTAVDIEVVFLGGLNCTYSGTISESGQMGEIGAIPFTCSDGSAGTIAISELQVTQAGITGTYTASYSTPAGCQVAGNIGGVRGTPF